MKKCFILFLLFNLMAIARPAGNEAIPCFGVKRKLALGVGDGYFLREIERVLVKENGNIVIHDRQQVLEFSSNGQYLRNFQKEGMGPGEMVTSAGMALSGDKLSLCGFVPKKVLRFDPSSMPCGEISLAFSTDSLRLIAADGECLYFSSMSFPEFEGNRATIDQEMNVLEFSEKSGRLSPAGQFPMRTDFIQGQGRATHPLAPFHAVMIGDTIFINHTEQFRIARLNVEARKIAGEISVPYERVRNSSASGARENYVFLDKRYPLPEPEFKWDIERMFRCGNRLWAVTSTRDKRRGVLIYVFDREGRLHEHFFLRTEGDVMAAGAGSVWIRQRDELGNIVLEKALMGKK